MNGVLSFLRSVLSPIWQNQNKTVKVTQMNKPTVPVTTALRQIIAEVAPTETTNFIYSDERRPAKGVYAVGVKIGRAKFTDQQVDTIVQKMKNRGYTFHYTRFSTSSTYVPGHRFCFSV